MDIEKLLAEMTLEEKAGLCSGADFWHTEAVNRLGIPSVMVSDGPHGLRKQDGESDHMGVGASVEAVGFPTASALACSFNRTLLKEVGNALGEECQAEDLAVLLGPGVNMKRSPICGRNFEYYSEDPCLAGELGAAFVNGVQEKNVGTSLKHFAANNQEYRRMSISAQVDERSLREIYLAAFERIVKKAQPWTIMCSYNRINGTYSCENDWLLNQVLRKEWGFEGIVMTDWGAMNHRVPSLKAGLDLEMPDCHGETDRQIVDAVKDGSLSMDVLNSSVRRILTLVDKFQKNKKQNATYNKEAHHQLARKVAADCAVLLKNDGMLPLDRGKKIAVIGTFAEMPRIQGGGSSHIHCFRIESALDVLGNVPYAPGFSIEQDTIDAALEKEAITLASQAEVAVIFAGLPDSFESEGFDRTHLSMPQNQNHLIEEICKVQPNTIVVLHNGSPVQMPWLQKVSAVLDLYLAGQAGGAAAVDLLYGDVNPSGKLAETFPLRLEDNPSFLNFPGTRSEVHYREGIYIGYRYYDKKKMDVLFPFGYGLSYTTFDYSHASVQVNGQTAAASAAIRDTDTITVSVDITNTGSRAGQEIVQLYVQNATCEETRPEKELRDFAKIALEPGETKTVTFTLDQRCFAYYNTDIHDWYAPSGTYHILLAASSRDIRQELTVQLESTTQIPFTAGDTTSCDDVYRFAKDPSPVDALLNKSGFAQATDKSGDESMGAGTADMMRAMFADTPLHSIISFSGEELTIDDIQNTIDAINQKESE